MNVVVKIRYKMKNRKDIYIRSYYFDIMTDYTNFELIKKCLQQFEKEKPTSILLGVYIEIE